MKKIIAILLVVALMSAMFVVPAHAHETEETVTPYAMICPKDRCGGTMILKTHYDSPTYEDAETVQGCTNYPFTHLHGYYYKYTRYVCNKCGYSTNVTMTRLTACPYA